MTQHGSAMTRYGFTITSYGEGCHVMVKNSAEGNKARTARYRAGLAARGIRPVQLHVPEGAHALLRQAAGLMTREQDPLEPRQAMRQASGTNDPGDVQIDQSGGEQVLAATVAAMEAVRAELAEAREAERRAEQRALAQAQAAQAAEEGVVAALARVEAGERTQVTLADKLQAAEVAAVQAQVEAERLRRMPGLRGEIVRWLIRQK